MRAVVQRVSRATVTVDQQVISSIGSGLLVLLGVSKEDDDSDIRYLADKVSNLRVFSDEEGKMNLSALDVGAEILVVSQFTLYGDCRKGRRPSFSSAAAGADAEAFYEKFCLYFEQAGLRVQKGQFGAHMDVELVNDGPVTLLLESKGDF